MPYIKGARREEILSKRIVGSKWKKTINIDQIQTAGDLNYAITEIILNYISTSKPGYQAINDVVGALEGAKLEFYRRLATPYEDEKIQENGDVYPEAKEN